MSEQKVCPTCGTEYPLSERFCPRDGTALRSANASADLLGSVIADRYHVIKKLGEGGMGTVYLAEHVKMGRKSALKVMNPGMNSDPDAIARFNREASNASRLSHPNICGIYDFGETSEGLIYLAMEFIEGKPLTDLIEEGNGLAPARAASVVHQTADALQVAHDAGIVHRDLKPDNIMVAKSRDGSDLVKVVDFGIAKASSSDAQKVTKTGLVVGTPEYMSPEQLAGDKLDGRSDIYSLALVAFNALTGTLPFPSETAQEAMIMRLTDRPRTLAEMRGDIAWPAQVQSVLDKALARDVAERYQSAATFGRDFAEALSAMPAVAATEGATVVVGAQSVPAGGPPVRRSAKTEAMPATRVAPKSPDRASSAAPVVPEKKSRLVPMLGGVAAVALIGYFGYGQLTKSGAEPAGSEPTAQAAAPQTGLDSSGLAAPAAPTDGNTTKLSNPKPTGGGTPNTNAGSSTTGGAPATPPVTAPTRRDVNAELIQNWRDRFLGNVSEAEAPRLGQQARREVEPILPQLSGSTLENAQFVLFYAGVLRDDSVGVCRHSPEVLRSSLTEIEKGMARSMRTAYGCPP